jgi:DNA-directed RNA polymerase specialized sigma subunit
LVKRENKKVYPTKWRDEEDIPYDINSDINNQELFDEIKEELKELQGTPMWSSAKIYELYTFSDKTMEELSEDIGISKSTTFLNVKKIKQHLKNKFNDKYNK